MGAVISSACAYFRVFMDSTFVHVGFHNHESGPPLAVARMHQGRKVGAIAFLALFAGSVAGMPFPLLFLHLLLCVEPSLHFAVRYLEHFLLVLH
jgi:hypothetical protein